MQDEPTAFRVSDLPERLIAKIAVESSGCWVWTGARTSRGYGEVMLHKRAWTTHRLVYTMLVGPIPAGLHICHRCDNPPCCNPGHLFAGTRSDNMRDMHAKGRRSPGRTRGESSFKAKLTEDVVRTMRERYEVGGVSIASLATEYGVTPATAWHAIRSNTWRHVI